MLIWQRLGTNQDLSDALYRFVAQWLEIDTLSIMPIIITQEALRLGICR